MAVAPHCSGDGSGLTEWLSNVTRITPASDEDPRPWLAPIASGNDRVLTFVHEAVHNWCFNSAVVHAQVYVAERARLNAVAYLRSRDDELARRVLDDLVRLEVVSELFRPLAEGLAQFAEYDAVSRFRSRACSPLPTALAWNFAGPGRIERQGERGFVEPYTTSALAAEILQNARLSEWAVTAKASLLRAPFRSSGRGYLPGYLAVKSMWRFLFQQDLRLYAESDLALTYLRAYFFEDVDLAAELLSPPGDDFLAGVNRLIDRFNRRLDGFFAVTPADVAVFEAAVDSDRPEESAGLRRTPEEHRRAQVLFTERVEAFASGVDTLMALRRFVTVLSVDVEVDDRAVVTWQGHEIRTVRGRGPGAYTMDVLLGTTGGHTLSRSAVLSRAGEAAVVLGPPEDEQALLAGFASRAQRESAARDLQQAAESIVAGDPALRMSRDHVRSVVHDVVDQIYHDTALRYSSGYEAMDRCGALMAEHGLRPLLDSAETLRQVAFLGLMASLNSYRAEMEKQFRQRGMDLPALLTTLDRAWAKHGFPPRIPEHELVIPFL